MYRFRTIDDVYANTMCEKFDHVYFRSDIIAADATGVYGT